MIHCVCYSLWFQVRECSQWCQYNMSHRTLFKYHIGITCTKSTAEPLKQLSFHLRLSFVFPGVPLELCWGPLLCSSRARQCVKNSVICKASDGLSTALPAKHKVAHSEPRFGSIITHCNSCNYISPLHKTIPAWILSGLILITSAATHFFTFASADECSSWGWKKKYPEKLFNEF